MAYFGAYYFAAGLFIAVAGGQAAAGGEAESQSEPAIVQTAAPAEIGNSGSGGAGGSGGRGGYVLQRLPPSPAIHDIAVEAMKRADEFVDHERAAARVRARASPACMGCGLRSGALYTVVGIRVCTQCAARFGWFATATHAAIKFTGAIAGGVKTAVVSLAVAGGATKVAGEVAPGYSTCTNCAQQWNARIGGHFCPQCGRAS